MVLFLPLFVQCGVAVAGRGRKKWIEVGVIFASMTALYRSPFAKGRILDIPIAVSIEIRIAFISLEVG
jgi:hypothetical protein